MAAPDPHTVEHIKDVNVRYHDAAASSYDAKWGIDFGPTGRAQVRAKLGKALGRWPERPFGDALEIGAGTGYFSLNLLQLGLIERATATDISAGMLAELGASASRLGLEVSTVETDAERLPFASDSFDLVFGHAVLHHIPGLELGVRGDASRASGRRNARVLRRAVALRGPVRGRPEALCSCGSAGVASGGGRLAEVRRGRKRDADGQPRARG